jgi:cell division protein FtsL
MNIFKDTVIVMLLLFSVYTVYHENELEKEYLKDITSLEAQMAVCEAEYKDSDEIISRLLLVQKIMEDGASLKEANIIVDTAEDNNVSPKF